MKFARKAMMTLASNIGVGILSLIGAVVISRVLGADGKGVVTLLFLTPSLVALILDAGLSIDNVHKISGTAGGNLRQKYSNSFHWMLLTTPLAIPMCVIGVWLSLRQSGDLVPSYVLLSVGLSPLILLVGLNRNILLGLGNITAYNFNTLLQPLLLLLCIVGLYALDLMTVFSVMLAYVASFLIVIVHTQLLIRERPARLDVAGLKSGLAFGFKGHLGTIVQYVNYRLDVFLLGVFSDIKQVGLYSVSYTCAEVIWRLPRAIGTILFPAVASMEKASASQLTSRVFRVSNLIVLVLCIIAALLAGFLIPLVFGDEFSGAVLPFLVLLPGIYFFSWHNTLIEDLKGRGLPQLKLNTASLAALATLVLDLVLIPRYAAVGAGIASSVAYFAAGTYSVYLFRKHTTVPLRDLFLLTAADFSRLRRLG